MKKEFKGILDFRPQEAKLWVGNHNLYSLLESLDNQRITIIVEGEPKKRNRGDEEEF